MTDFKSLSLHDAVLDSIKINWSKFTAELSVFAFVDKDTPAVEHKLVFFGVKDISCPHLSPWGDSNSINNVFEAPGEYKIEMQSGDVITIKCDKFEFINISL